MAIDNSLPIKNMQQRQIMKKMTSSNSITALHLAAALATESRFKKLLSLAGMDVNAADEVRCLHIFAMVVKVVLKGFHKECPYRLFDLSELI
jgi:hypothetical protein